MGSPRSRPRSRLGSDDAEQGPTGGVDLTSTDLELVTDGTKVQRVGLRFANLQVPAGATITRAWIQFQTDEVSTDTAALTLRAEAADNTPTYVGTNSNLSNRAVTSASVAWNPPAWNTVSARTAAQQTPDISSLVQAVVSRPGWAQGNALADPAHRHRDDVPPRRSRAPSPRSSTSSTAPARPRATPRRPSAPAPTSR